MAQPLRSNQRIHSGAERIQPEKREQYLAFEIGGDTFAMEIGSIREVLQYGNLTRVPLMPAFLRGVLNLRGAVVPVIDLAVRFGRAPTEVIRRTCVVILEVVQGGEPLTLGVVVDNVSEVLEIGPSEIEPAPAFGSRLRSEFLAGVGKVGGKFVILLDVNHVVAIDELAALASGSMGPDPAFSHPVG